MKDKINVQNRYLAITVEVTGRERRGTLMAIDNRLEVLLFQQRRDQVVELPLARMFLPVEFVQAFCPLRRIASGTRPNLVVYALDDIAGLALRPNRQRLRHDMLSVQVTFTSAIRTSFLGLDKLPIFVRYLRP